VVVEGANLCAQIHECEVGHVRAPFRVLGRGRDPCRGRRGDLCRDGGHALFPSLFRARGRGRAHDHDHVRDHVRGRGRDLSVKSGAHGTESDDSSSTLDCDCCCD